MSGGAFACDVCDMYLNCYQQYMQHKAGKKHLSKAKQKRAVLENTKEAEVDQPQKFYGGQFVAASKSQAENAIGVSDPVKEAVVQNMLGNLPTKRKASVTGECVPCGMVFNSKDQEAMHLNGKKHAKKMKVTDFSVEKAATFICSFCNVQVNSVDQMEQHRSGSQHQKKVEAAKKDQDEARLESKLPKLTTSLTPETPAAPPRPAAPPQPTAPSRPAPPLPAGGIPPPPAQLEKMKYENFSTAS